MKTLPGMTTLGVRVISIKVKKLIDNQIKLWRFRNEPGTYGGRSQATGTTIGNIDS
jgi:hypothetical protein